MEVRNANIALTNRAAAAIDNSGSNGKGQQHAMKVNSAVPEENQELDDESQAQHAARKAGREGRGRDRE